MGLTGDNRAMIYGALMKRCHLLRQHQPVQPERQASEEVGLCGIVPVRVFHCARRTALRAKRPPGAVGAKIARRRMRLQPHLDRLQAEGLGVADVLEQQRLGSVAHHDPTSGRNPNSTHVIHPQSRLISAIFATRSAAAGDRWPQRLQGPWQLVDELGDFPQVQL